MSAFHPRRTLAALALSSATGQTQNVAELAAILLSDC